MNDISQDYAESVAIAGIRSDAGVEFSLRLGRFPARGFGSLWAGAYLGGQSYGAGDNDLVLADFTGPTPIENERVVFEVSGLSSARFESFNRHSNHMQGSVHALAMVHQAAHPPSGRGDTPMKVEAFFEASHQAVRVRTGRMEVMGRVTASIVLPSGEYQFVVPGKWHEQIGDRPRFGPAFVYLNLRGEGIELLASARKNRAWGYAYLGDQVIMVNGFTLDPPTPKRAFKVALENGKNIQGEAVTIRETSVPIEGRRRPGATVVASTNIGDMVGHLNDWQPDD
jgi:hypothetical protein